MPRPIWQAGRTAREREGVYAPALRLERPGSAQRLRPLRGVMLGLDPSIYRRCEESSRLEYAALTRFLRAGMETNQFGAWHCSLDWGARLLLTDDDPIASPVAVDACATA